jgi:hypothetical protein
MTAGPTNDRHALGSERVSPSQSGVLRDALLAMLAEHGYTVDVRLDGQDLRFTAVTDDGREWRTQVLVDERHPVARLYLYLDLEYPHEYREWVLELTCRVNSLLAIGGFDFDWDSGAVTFRHGRDFTGQTIDAVHVTRLLKVAVVALRLLSRAYAYHATPDITPAGALDAARVAEDLADDGVSSDEGRRALIRLVK